MLSMNFSAASVFPRGRLELWSEQADAVVEVDDRESVALIEMVDDKPGRFLGLGIFVPLMRARAVEDEERGSCLGRVLLGAA